MFLSLREKTRLSEGRAASRERYRENLQTACQPDGSGAHAYPQNKHYRQICPIGFFFFENYYHFFIF
jgi:hypothetical protein